MATGTTATTPVVWNGVRLVEMLDAIVDGKRIGFEGTHGVATTTESVPFDTLYSDHYHNYFCKSGDSFLLVLHPDVRPLVEAMRKPAVMKHCWFGHNTDSVLAITAAEAAKCYGSECEEATLKKNEESELPPGWTDASGTVWKSKEDAFRAVFGVSSLKDLVDDEEQPDGSAQYTDLFDDAAFGLVKDKLLTRIDDSKVTDDWIRAGVLAFDPEAAPLDGVGRDELTERFIEQLMYDETDEDRDEGPDDEAPTEEAARPSKRFKA